MNMGKVNVLLASNQRLNSSGVGNPIMYRMAKSLKRQEEIGNVDFLPFDNRFKTLWLIRHKAKDYDIVHIHFGGLYALIIRIFLIGLRVKTMITFHGTDIHAKSLKTTKSLLKKAKIKINQLSSFACLPMFNLCGFVSKEMLDYLPKWMKTKYSHRIFIQHLGVDYNTFHPMKKEEACKHLNIPVKPYALFSDVSGTNIKRRDIAEKIIENLKGEFSMLLMTKVKPEEVPYYINSSSFLLLTSDEEGSPNIIRECLTLNKPIFSVDVGDAKEQISGLQNSAIISREPVSAANTIRQYLKKPYMDFTRESKKKVLDFDLLNHDVVKLYLKILEE